jgi:uncharacterized lipoprotein YddW (UPF0748 family)
VRAVHLLFGALVALLPRASVVAQPVAEAEAVALHGGAEPEGQGAQRSLRLPDDAYVEWNPAPPPTTDAGTLSLWVKPMWAAEDSRSHTFASFEWSDAAAGYFALSQGWWEPLGRNRLYLVFANQRYAFCMTPWSFDYQLFSPDQWTQLVVSWQAGNPGYVRLSVDGKALCERKIAFPSGAHLQGPLYLGSDRGAGDQSRGRSAAMLIKDWQLTPLAATPQMVWAAYRAQGGSARSKWMLAATPGEPAASSTERRVMFDEDTHWADSRLEIQARLRRVKTAGFNVYVPCVWDGAHAFFSSKVGPLAKALLDPLQPEYDPLAYLLAEAHRQKIEVHPWFVVAGRPAGPSWPDSYVAGAPPGAFNVHSREFRDFIVALVSDAAQRFEVDGINLDYIRSIGPCTDAPCAGDYQRRYGREVLKDWQAQESGATVPSLIEFNREAVTDIVRRISVAARRFRPAAVLSIDTVPFDHYREHQGVDERGWLDAHLIDTLVDMSYDDPIDVATLDRAMQDFGAARQIISVRNYELFSDIAVNRSGEVMSDHVRLIRGRWHGAGIGFYHYPHLDAEQEVVLGQGVFTRAAAPAWVH